MFDWWFFERFRRVKQDLKGNKQGFWLGGFKRKNTERSSCEL